MLPKIRVKNPGCDFCRYYRAPFTYKGEATRPACLKTARRIYQPIEFLGHKRKWKWTDCDYAAEKNKDRFCEDFKIKTFLTSLSNQVLIHLHQAGEELPPTYKKEIWWET